MDPNGWLGRRNQRGGGSKRGFEGDGDGYRDQEKGSERGLEEKDFELWRMQITTMYTGFQPAGTTRGGQESQEERRNGQLKAGMRLNVRVGRGTSEGIRAFTLAMHSDQKEDEDG